MTPIIGITADVSDDSLASGRRYADAVARAGAVPILIGPPFATQSPHAGAGPDHNHASPAEIEHVAAIVRHLDGFVLTGGDDPDMNVFGVPTHPKAAPIHPDRQRFETLLLATLERDRPAVPVLAVCLGFQLAALHAGGTLDQSLLDSRGKPVAHAHHPGVDDPPDTYHPLTILELPFEAQNPLGPPGVVTISSRHRQAVTEPGALEPIALAEHDIIEAAIDLRRDFFVGVQWHPERAGPESSGDGLFQQLVQAARRA